MTNNLPLCFVRIAELSSQTTPAKLGILSGANDLGILYKNVYLIVILLLFYSYFLSLG
ncbi:hypothetical protein NIES4106_03360 [Fischerella sp. NIES-4106]|nr:hypothetical protein NIES4106_03360 [Fischerella sp. NIES-4106]